jgi:Holliday junction resolvasome RuvABC endonuclease subunit
MPKVYLGIDQSLTEPGIALILPNGDIETNVIKTKTTGAQRLFTIKAIFKDWLYWLLPSFSAIEMYSAIEGYSVNSINRPFDLGSVYGVFSECVYSLTSKEPLVVPPTSLKKFASGNGHTKDLLYAVKQKWGYQTDNDNIADAVALAHFSKAAVTDQFRDRKEREAVYAITLPKTKKVKIRINNKGNI